MSSVLYYELYNGSNGVYGGFYYVLRYGLCHALYYGLYYELQDGFYCSPFYELYNSCLMAASVMGSWALLRPLLCFCYGPHHKLYSNLYYGLPVFMGFRTTRSDCEPVYISFIMASMASLWRPRLWALVMGFTGGLYCGFFYGLHRMGSISRLYYASLLGLFRDLLLTGSAVSYYGGLCYVGLSGELC